MYKPYTYDARGRLLRTEQKTEYPDEADRETKFITRYEQRYDAANSELNQENRGNE